MMLALRQEKFLPSVVKALKPIWKTSENFEEVYDAGDNIFLFLFQKEEDMNRVMWASLWSFNKYLLVLHKFEPGDSVSTIGFDRAPFWIQSHGLPMRMQTNEVAEKIVGPLRELEKVEIGDKGFSMGKYLRGTWKRIPREFGDESGRNDGALEIGDKRKEMTPLKEVRTDDWVEKRSKKEAEVVMAGNSWQNIWDWRRIGGGCNAVPLVSMNSLAWNCRGLGNRRTVRALEKVVTSEDPILIFLIKTKLVMSEMEEIKAGLKRIQGLVVPSKGRSSGLALLWKQELKVAVQTYSNSHIDAVISPNDSTQDWRFTGFYGNPETSKREELWLLLKRLASTNTLPWFYIGEFNELMNSRENEGGSTHPARQMKNFCEVISTCQLCDFGYVGQDFTWTRRFGDRGWIRKRLDRALVSTSWVSKFPKT
uniref:DUF4283 domain-containing protein n=1 Tax=Quercus lobata TaxID=97700 RepID=A0A7N2KPM2_QUELO